MPFAQGGARVDGLIQISPIAVPIKAINHLKGRAKQSHKFQHIFSVTREAGKYPSMQLCLFLTQTNFSVRAEMRLDHCTDRPSFQAVTTEHPTWLESQRVHRQDSNLSRPGGEYQPKLSSWPDRRRDRTDQPTALGLTMTSFTNMIHLYDQMQNQKTKVKN